MSEETINIGWKVPSNIALIKYWGKKGHQLPINASLSITLEKAATTTLLSYQRKIEEDHKVTVHYYFENQRHPKFEEKIVRLITAITTEMPFLTQYKMIFHSENSFPHSTGIASSASSMGALALCLVSMEEQVTGLKKETCDFFRRASSIARLGSGSASRSMFGGIVTWGTHTSLDRSSDEYASALLLPKESRLAQLRDAILIISSREKNISSTVGHSLMNDHPYREGRIKQANNHLQKMEEAIRTQNMTTIAEIAENEALSLHALLMSSTANGILLHPNTLLAIEAIRHFRDQSGIDIFFTLDAGPNVHLLYFEDQRQQVHQFIHESLLSLCEDGQWIDDQMGSGPVQLKINQKE